MKTKSVELRRSFQIDVNLQPKMDFMDLAVKDYNLNSVPQSNEEINQARKSR